MSEEALREEIAREEWLLSLDWSKPYPSERLMQLRKQLGEAETQ